MQHSEVNAYKQESLEELLMEIGKSTVNLKEGGSKEPSELENFDNMIWISFKSETKSFCCR